MDRSVLQQVPEVYKWIYEKHWHTIRPSVKQGRIRVTYHYPLLEDDAHTEIKTRLHEVLGAHEKFKINVAFGFILKRRVTDELKFFHPSNNTMLFDKPRLITNRRDIVKLESDVEAQDAFEYARLQRPSTNWTVERIICVRFDVYKLMS